MNLTQMGFEVVGTVTEHDRSKGEAEGRKWDNPIVGLSFLGGTQRLKVTEEQHVQFVMGKTYHVKGVITENGGYRSFRPETIKDVSAKQAG